MLHEQSPSSGFEQFGLQKAVLRALQEAGYIEPTPIQSRTLPALMENKDLIGQAQTGTGKTAAFSLPLLSRLQLEAREPQGLVLTPTRELALQVSEALRKYGRYLQGLAVATLYGGADMRAQLRQLRRGAQVVVGTPGRLRDHLRRGSLNLRALRFVVLDEGDEMLRMGFIEDVEWILRHTPADRQTALFSATMPAPIRKICQHHLRDSPGHRDRLQNLYRRDGGATLLQSFRAAQI